MKVFVSWSKEQSRDVGTAFAAWLPNVLHECSDPFISTEVVKGDAWFETITRELKLAKVGIVFITPANQDETWLNFESGAMLTELGKQRLCPVLVGMTKADYQGPLKNVQLTEFDDAADMLKLIQTLNGECERSISDVVLKRSFEDNWPRLQKTVADAAALRRDATTTSKKRSDGSKLDEVLELVREIAMAGPTTGHGVGLTKKVIFEQTKGWKAMSQDSREAGLIGREAVGTKKGQISGRISAVAHTDQGVEVAFVESDDRSFTEIIPLADLIIGAKKGAGKT